MSQTVKSEVLESLIHEVVLHDGHELCHLTEEQHTVVCGVQLGQDAVQQLKFARRTVQIRPEGKGTVGLRCIFRYKE